MTASTMEPIDSGWRDARRILCVRLDTIGDVLMTGPAIRALKRACPERHLTLLTSYPGVEAGRLLADVDVIIPYDAPWMKATARQSECEADQAMIRRLAEAGFDAAVLFTVYSQSPLPAALLCYLAGIPLRLAHCRENPYQLLTHWIRETEPDGGIRHEVRRQLDLVAAVGAHTDDERLSVAIPLNAVRAVERLLVGLIDQHDWLVVHPGASAASRRYPPELFAAVAARLGRELNRVIFFTGSAAEGELIQDIQRRLDVPSHSLAGLLDLPMLAALLSRAPLLISNNTSAVHIAAAVGTPVVDLYALTNPQHTPWQVPHRLLYHDVPCKYCYKSVCPEGHHDCLRLVAPDAVVRAAVELLARSGFPDKEIARVHPGH